METITTSPKKIFWKKIHTDNLLEPEEVKDTKETKTIAVISKIVRRSAQDPVLKGKRGRQKKFIIGTKFSENSYKAVTNTLQYFDHKNDKMILLHILDINLSPKQELFIEHIKCKYKKFLEGMLPVSSFEIIIQPRIEGLSYIEQLNKHALNTDFSILVIGSIAFNLKKLSLINENSTINKFYDIYTLIERLTTPCFIVKNSISRELMVEKKLTWLVFIKSADNFSFLPLLRTLYLMDISMDDVQCIFIKRAFTKEKDEEEILDIEEPVALKFFNAMHKKNIDPKKIMFNRLIITNKQTSKYEHFKKWYLKRKNKECDVIVVGNHDNPNYKYKEYKPNKKTRLIDSLIEDPEINILIDC